MRLDLPSRIPLPDDVRHRALDRVLAGIEEPASRRAGWFPALVAAAVVVAVVVTTTFAVSRTAESPPLELAGPPEAPLSATPVPTPVPLEPLDRCRAAELDPEGGEYPPAAQWRETANYDLGGIDSVVVIDDRFACHLGARTVTVSPMDGAPIGTASLVRLAPAVVAVLNPEGEPVTVSGAADAYDRESDVIIVQTDAVFGEDYRITVGDSYDGPPPPVVPTGRPNVDRDLPARIYDEANPQVMNTEACVATAPPAQNSEPELWIPAFEVDTVGPPVQVMAIGDLAAAFCVVAPDGPRFISGSLPNPVGPGAWIAYAAAADAPGGGSDGEPDRILVAVPDGTERVEVRGRLQEGAGDGGAVCPIDGALALCQLAVAPGTELEVIAFDGPTGEGRAIE